MDYSDRQFSSDLSAFRSDGTVYTDSITFSGSITKGSSQTKTSSGITVNDLDFYKVLYDNSIYSSGKYRDINLEPVTLVYDTTSASELSAELSVKLTGNTITLTGTITNPYSATATLQTTTINVRVVIYDNTIS